MSDELHSFCLQYILEPSLFRLAVYLRDPGSAGGDRAGVGGARVGARQEGARILNKCLSPLFFSLQTLLNTEPSLSRLASSTDGRRCRPGKLRPGQTS